MIARACGAAGIVVLGAVLQTSQAPFRSGVDLVEVDVSVMRGGQPVPGLTAANFTLTDNGVAQEVTSVRLDRLPLSVLLALDVSASVRGEKLAQLVGAARQLVGTLRDGDQGALVTFSQAVRVDVPVTRDLPSIARALAGLQGSGATSIIDAVHVALQLRPLDASRSVLILFTDGLDNASWITPADLVNEARRTGLVIHAIELRDDNDIPEDLRRRASMGRPAPAAHPLLEPLAAASGGRVWSAASPRDLQGLFKRALEEMRARYLLAFTPTGVDRTGWHTLKVSLRNARGEVTARPAYFAAPTKQ